MAAFGARAAAPTKSRAIMERREFISPVGGTAAGWPLAAIAQHKTLPHVGFLLSGSRDEAAIEAFRKGLSERGFVEDVDVKVEYRWAEDRYDRLPQMIADLVQRQVNVIVAVGSPVDWQRKPPPRLSQLSFTSASTQ